MAQGEMGTPTSWLIGDAPDGRLLGTLTFSQLFGVRLKKLSILYFFPPQDSNGGSSREQTKRWGGGARPKV